MTEVVEQAAVDELGPVDYLVVEFPGSDFKGEILGHDPMAQDRLMMEAQTSGVRPAR